MVYKCSNCGFKAGASVFFRKEKGGLFGWKQTMCEACTPYQPTQQEKHLLPRLLISTATWGMVIFFHYSNDPSASLAVLIMYLSSLITAPVKIFVHEAGHAFVAKWVGEEIWYVRVGQGPISRKLSLGGINFEICRYAFSEGRTCYFRLNGQSTRTKRGLILLAGPLANILCAAIALALSCLIGFMGGPSLIIAAAFAGFGVSQAYMGLSNLFPYHLKSADNLWSDGGQLLNLLKSQALPDPHAQQLSRVLALNHLGRFDELIPIARENIWNSPYKMALAAFIMHALSCNKGDQAVLDFYVENRAQFMASDDAKADIANGLAWVQANASFSATRLGDPTFSILADTLSAAAFYAEPDNPTFMGNRGAWLIARDQAEAGIKLLSKATRLTQSHNDKAEFCLFLANGWQQLGDTMRAHLYSDLSQHLRRS